MSEVDLSVFPNIKGTVVTTSSIAPGNTPTELEIGVQNTRVAGSNTIFSAITDNVTVPVDGIFAQLRGPSSTVVRSHVTYLDDKLRIGRTLPDNQLYVYVRA